MEPICLLGNVNQNAAEIKILKTLFPNRIHVNRLIDYISVCVSYHRCRKTIKSLEGQEEVHSGDTLPRAFRFFGRIKTYPTEYVLHKYPHEQPLNLKRICMCASTNINYVFFFSKGEKKTLEERWLPTPILKYVKVGGVIYKTLEKDA